MKVSDKLIHNGRESFIKAIQYSGTVRFVLIQSLDGMKMEWLEK